MNTNWLRSTTLFATVAAGTLLTLASAAQAFTFKTNYTLDPALSGDNVWRGDILLQSVEYGGQVYSDFAFVNGANIIHNDPWTGGNTGAASADKGHHATIGISQEFLTNEGAVAALGNSNLSSIIDGEDRGSFIIDIFFDKAVQDVLVWERGINSAMDLHAIDAQGNLIGSVFHISKTDWAKAGFKMGTLEIGSSIQDVGSRGVSLADFGLTEGLIYGLRVSAQGTAIYNGPDWKIVGVAGQEPEAVPEPAAMLGLLTVGALGFVARKRG